MEKFQKVLELMKAKGGRIETTDADLVALLGPVGPKGTPKSVWYRLPTYVSFIRKYANLDVKGIREGRKVVAYELVATAQPVDEPAEQTPVAAE